MIELYIIGLAAATTAFLMYLSYRIEADNAEDIDRGR